ncbi:GTP-binding protein YPT31/YPT8 [Symbiodinium microadriaticum]|uniref:GTP-binding protein YPT31/YPT8 n=1 Tax=Symbiodinium microadriaticum TaxID=2951 RepID=A0A1Q9DIN5_SYMMI|nr:GTP-binding protein YPT31/YPT8 [Symbiodinium microadriaticum]CAE7866066.1 YPT31 [Symbiodinium microadriaticum]CAE7884002.1 YPT31 [Symbiodinium sp. KB8]
MYISVGSPVRASAAVPTFGINAVLGRASLEGTLSKMARWTAAEQRDQARGDPAGLSVRRMKVVLIGDSSVGKSALVYRFINNTLLADPKATVGISFFKQTLMDPLMSQQYPLQIWDTAGQEKFQSVTTHHYRAADGALLVFDIANERSFQNLDKWLAELRENTDPSVVVALVGTKADLSAQRAVSTERAQGYARGNGLLYVETSAYWNKYEGGEKDLAVGVEQIFLRLVRGIIQTQKELGRNPARLDMSGYPEAIHLEEEGRRRDSECAC